MQELRLHANKPLSRQLFSHLTTSESALLYTEHSRHLYGLYHTPVMLNKVTQLTWINNGTVSSWTKAVVMLCICHCQLWCNLTRLLSALSNSCVHVHACSRVVLAAYNHKCLVLYFCQSPITTQYSLTNTSSCSFSHCLTFIHSFIYLHRVFKGNNNCEQTVGQDKLSWRGFRFYPGDFDSPLPI